MPEKEGKPRVTFSCNTGLSLCNDLRLLMIRAYRGIHWLCAEQFSFLYTVLPFTMISTSGVLVPPVIMIIISSAVVFTLFQNS